MTEENKNTTAESSLELFNLGLCKGERKTAKRRGRGNASGSGKTAGRGHKGLLARSGGKVRAGFEGGQMPLYRRIPKVGFRSRKKRLGINQFAIVNLGQLEKFEDGATVDVESLAKIGIKTGARQRAGIKVLGFGSLTKKLTVKVNSISASAQNKIEAAGGTVEIV